MPTCQSTAPRVFWLGQCPSEIAATAAGLGCFLSWWQFILIAVPGIGELADAEDGIALADAAEDGVNIEEANFAQTTASSSFSSGGSFAGQTISDVASELSSGALSPDDVPVQVIVRDGDTLILNTRSALALEQAGIPRSEWVLDNVTGDPAAEARLSGQLARNGLGSGGTPTVRITGGG